MRIEVAKRCGEKSCDPILVDHAEHGFLDYGSFCNASFTECLNPRKLSDRCFALKMSLTITKIIFWSNIDKPNIQHGSSRRAWRTWSTSGCCTSWFLFCTTDPELRRCAKCGCCDRASDKLATWNINWTHAFTP